MSKEHGRSAPSRLRIAVIGVGGIGSTFAFHLARTGGHEVTVVARPGSLRLQQLARDGGIVNTQGERAEVCIVDKLSEGIAYDLVLVTLLAHQVEAVLPGLQRSAAKWIQFMFNQFDPEKLRDAVGVERCSFGMPFLQASLDGEGKLIAKVGAAGQKSKMNRKECVDIFNAAGLSAVFEPDMLRWLRCHVPLAVALESVSVAGVRRGGGGATWRESLMVARGMKEGFTLVQRLGCRLYPFGQVATPRNSVTDRGEHVVVHVALRSVRELLATAANECRALVDVLVANASQAQPPVSVNKILAMKP